MNICKFKNCRVVNKTQEPNIKVRLFFKCDSRLKHNYSWIYLYPKGSKSVLYNKIMFNQLMGEGFWLKSFK